MRTQSYSILVNSTDRLVLCRELVSFLTLIIESLYIGSFDRSLADFSRARDTGEE